MRIPFLLLAAVMPFATPAEARERAAGNQSAPDLIKEVDRAASELPPAEEKLVRDLLTPPAPPPGGGCGSATFMPSRPPALGAPAVGASYKDPAFGCTVKRLTESGVTHSYSSVNPFNSDSTLVLLERPGGMIHVRDLSGKVRAELNRAGILPSSSASWSRKNPNLLYFHTGNQLKSHDVAAGKTTVLHTFAEYKEVSFGLGEGDISADGDHFAVVGDRRWGFIHTISTGKSTARKDFSSYASHIDNADVTPGNRLTMIHDQPGGTQLFDASMNHAGQALDYIGHSDRGRDTDGSDMIVITNSADKTPIPDCQNGIVKKRLPGGPEKCLLPLDWSLAVHVSCNAYGQDFCLVSTYSTGSNFNIPVKNELLKVKLDGTKVIRLAHTRSSGADYQSMPRAALSGDGRWALFDSDMAGGGPSVYLLDLR